MSYYAIAKGVNIGIFNTWEDCKANTNGYSGAIFKKFSIKEAENFLLDFDIGNSVFEADYYVYTDGSCINNGKENAIAGIGIYFGENDVRNVSQRVIGKQSNNTGELGAIYHLYDIIESDILSGKNR